MLKIYLIRGLLVQKSKSLGNSLKKTQFLHLRKLRSYLVGEQFTQRGKNKR